MKLHKQDSAVVDTLGPNPNLVGYRFVFVFFDYLEGTGTMYPLTKLCPE